MAQVFLDRVAATAHVESIAIKEEVKPGQFFKLGVLDADGERRLAEKATGNADANVFLAPEVISYGDPHFDTANVTLKDGDTGRAYHKDEGTIISVTKDLVSGAAVGDHVDVGDGGLGFKKASSGNGVGLVIGKENHGVDGEVFVIAFG